LKRVTKNLDEAKNKQKLGKKSQTPCTPPVA
jgi:hypothetical protein